MFNYKDQKNIFKSWILVIWRRSKPWKRHFCIHKESWWCHLTLEILLSVLKLLISRKLSITTKQSKVYLHTKRTIKEKRQSNIRKKQPTFIYPAYYIQAPVLWNMLYYLVPTATERGKLFFPQFAVQKTENFRG